MGKCILAGHPPAGGQVGFGTYTGDGASSRTISLGFRPTWLLWSIDNRWGAGWSQFREPHTTGFCLVHDGAPWCELDTESRECARIEIIEDGFTVIGSRSLLNISGYKYFYIYGI